MYRSQSLRAARKTMILGVMLFALWFLLFDRPANNVRAASCFDATLNLSDCYFSCTQQNTICNNGPYGPVICQQAYQACLLTCEGVRADFGIDCGFAPYSHPLNPSDACNGEQVYANCLAGTNVPLNVRNVYIDCMANYGGDLDYMLTCCEETRDAYLNIGCF